MAEYTPVVEDENSEEEQQTSLKSVRTLSATPNQAMPLMQMPVVEIDGVMYPVIKTNMVTGVLPVAKGGTGIEELTGGKLLASNEDGSLFEEVNVDVQKLSGLSGNIQSQINTLNGKSRTLVANVPTTGWVTNTHGAGYMQTITVNGITVDDNPVVGLVTTASTTNDLKAERMAYACIDKISTDNGSITIECFEKAPTHVFSISLHCIGA
jgi:hypothetical protein